MSNLKTKRVQIGDHSTATNNFVMHQSDTPDGKVHISNGTLDDHTSKMTLTHDGKLGVGTDSPGALLSIPAGGSSTPRFAIESATDDNDFTITQYEDGNGTYTMLGQNVKLNSGGNNTVSDAAHKTAGIQFDARNNGTLTFVTGAANTATENMQISSAGYVTTPNQPCFSVTHNTVSSVDARSGYVAFRSINTTYINQGNHFTSSDGRFTAPVAGNYLFGCTLRYDSFTDQYFYVTIKKNDAYGARDLKSSNGNYLHASVHVILPMAVNDYVHVGLNSNADSSIDINSDTHFYGYLLG